MFYFSNFYPACFSAFCSLFSSFEIFIVSFQYSSLYYSHSRSIFCLTFLCFQVFLFHAAYLTFFAVFPLCLRRHLQDESENPSINRPPCVVPYFHISRSFLFLFPGFKFSCGVFDHFRCLSSLPEAPSTRWNSEPVDRSSALQLFFQMALRLAVYLNAEVFNLQEKINFLISI